MKIVLPYTFFCLCSCSHENSYGEDGGGKKKTNYKTEKKKKKRKSVNIMAASVFSLQTQLKYTE